jgi:farnesyl-diphosphate farnesyltransferase
MTRSRRRLGLQLTGRARAIPAVARRVVASLERHRRMAACGDDLRYCATILPSVSRTFALSIAALPGSLHDAVLAAYLLCRLVDSIEDEAGIDPVTREALFACFEETLCQNDRLTSDLERALRSAGVGEGSADGDLCRRAGAPVRVFRALPACQRRVIRPRVLVMLSGMREYCRRGDGEGGLRIESLEDLERYCYYVAGTVGRLLTDLFAMATPDSEPMRRETIARTAVSFGVGLQMVNIVKDVAEDFERGTVFLPADQLESGGCPVSELLNMERRDAGLAVVRSVCARARFHLDKAIRYTVSWPLPQGEPVRQFCAVPLLLALATLGEVENGRDTLRAGESPKVSREVVAGVLTNVQSAASDDEELRALLELARRPFEPAENT